jgi:protein-S-isoprenylcysteine O-methyltransferase Ste14
LLARGIWALFWIGWATVLLSTFLINHFDLFGLRQGWAYCRNHEIPPAEFHMPLFYKVVRHPLDLGFVIAFWAAPTMSVGRLFFAAATTAYILIAIQFEEHDLINHWRRLSRLQEARIDVIAIAEVGEAASGAEVQVTRRWRDCGGLPGFRFN